MCGYIDIEEIFTCIYGYTDIEKKYLHAYADMYRYRKKYLHAYTDK